VRGGGGGGGGGGGVGGGGGGGVGSVVGFGEFGLGLGGCICTRGGIGASGGEDSAFQRYLKKIRLTRHVNMKISRASKKTASGNRNARGKFRKERGDNPTKEKRRRHEGGGVKPLRTRELKKSSRFAA